MIRRSVAMAVMALLIAAAQGAAQAGAPSSSPSGLWVIGFDVEGTPAETFLQDLAGAGRGQFLLASDSATLHKAFDQAVGHTVRPFVMPRRRGLDPFMTTAIVLLVIVDGALLVLIAMKLGWIDRTRWRLR